mmetsp:Transcript_3730/g.9789  ORF Transcript_3730/g.9789 Transcript_3730/m.9789 type:complete len:296 (+) Transcript_3730:22-909(+)
MRDDSDDLPEGDVERRVVFDIGSRTTKCVVADVEIDVETATVISVCAAEEATISFALDCAQDEHGALSERAQHRGMQVLAGLAQSASTLGATACAAVLTGALSRAPNAGTFVARLCAELGVRAKLAMTEDEAHYALLTARSLGATNGMGTTGGMCTAQGAGGDGDSGGACWQQGSGLLICADTPDGLAIYTSAVGVDVARIVCAELQGRGCNAAVAVCVSPNPVSKTDAAALVTALQERLDPAPSWLQLHADRVTAIGGDGSIFATAAALISGVDAPAAAGGDAADAASTIVRGG